MMTAKPVRIKSIFLPYLDLLSTVASISGEIVTSPHDKAFLKRNELAEILSAPTSFLERNRFLVIAIAAFAVIVFLGAKYLDVRMQRHIREFNKSLFEVSQSANKEPGFRQIIEKFPDIPAVNYARVQLAQTLIDLGQAADAEKVLLEGLENSAKPDLYSTILVLKLVALTREQKDASAALVQAGKYEKNIMKSFSGSFQLMIADLHIAAGNRDDARKVLQVLAASEVSGKGFAAGIIEEARERLLLLDLGKL